MKRTLTLEQCKALLSVIEMQGSNNSKVMDRALVIGLLLVGSGVRTWTWEAYESKLVTMPTGVYEAFKNLAKHKKVNLFVIKSERFIKVHWLGSSDVKKFVFTLTPTLSRRARESAWTTQEVSRRLNRFGRMAGILDCNLRTVVNTHHLLLDLYGDAEAVGEALGIDPIATLTPASTTSWHTSLKGRGSLKAEALAKEVLHDDEAATR